MGASVLRNAGDLPPLTISEGSLQLAARRPLRAPRANAVATPVHENFPWSSVYSSSSPNPPSDPEGLHTPIASPILGQQHRPACSKQRDARKLADRSGWRTRISAFLVFVCWEGRSPGVAARRRTAREADIKARQRQRQRSKRGEKALHRKLRPHRWTFRASDIQSQ